MQFLPLKVIEKNYMQTQEVLIQHFSVRIALLNIYDRSTILLNIMSQSAS